MRCVLKICSSRTRPRICLHLTAYCTALSVIVFYQAISVENKLEIVAAEIQHRKHSINATVKIVEASPRISNAESGLQSSPWSSRNESSPAGSKSLGPSLNESVSGSESLQLNVNRTKHVLEMLREKGVVTFGGKEYENRYKLFQNFTESQIDGIIAAFGIPNLNSSIFKEQLLTCTGLTLAKAKKSVKVTDEGNVVMPKHFQKCKSMSFQKNRKTVALFSFPGSGNSWVRQLLETTTGIYTGTYKDCDNTYISNGMIGEGVYTDNVIAVKIHRPNTDDLKWLYRHSIIYVVRNPFDAILAEWNRWQSSFEDHDTAHLSTTTEFGK